MKTWAVFLFLVAGISWGQESRLPVVAVFEFQTSNVDSATGRSFTQRLQGELQKLGKYSMVDRAQMDGILKEQGFQGSGVCNNNDCQVQVGQLLGADFMVQGNLGKVGDLFSITVNLVDVETGRIQRSATRDEKGGIENLYAKGLAALALEITSSEQPQTKEPERTSHVGWWIGGGVTALAAVGASIFLITREPETKTKITEQTLETDLNVK